MNLDRGLMQEVHASSLSSVVLIALGSEGDVLAKRLLRVLPDIHARLPIEVLPDGLLVFAALDDSVTFPDSSGPLTDLSSVTTYPHRGFTVQVLEQGYRVRPAVLDPRQFPHSLSYRFLHPKQETWHVGDVSVPVFNPASDHLSAFAVPLFSSLERALDNYATRQVHECRCRELQLAWRDDLRLFWNQRPEEQVRRSLEHHLVSALRAHVEVEHVVDERKESDIWIYWAFSTHAALIECKWLGRSASDPADDGTRKSTDFTQADAVAGLGQLADYLDRQRPRADGRSVRGHLVVIDGRRRGLTDPDQTTTVEQEDLLHYEYRDIEWPAHLVARTDMAAPRRMFCRPKL